MLHKEDFCEHFCEMSDKEIVDDIRKSIASFMKQREDGEDFGAKMVHKAKLRIDAVHDVRSDAGKQGGRPRKETTADGDIREDSQAKHDGSAITRNETRATDALGPSANHYGEAATSDGAEAATCRESGATEPTTFSNPMRRVPQNEAPAHGFSGGRTAQGTMSRSPEAAAQSGKVYDQETDQVSTGEARQSQARESQRRAGADSVRGTPLHSAPARSSGPIPDDVQLVYDFAAAENLDPVDAYECWNVTVNERDGKTADGKKVTNWKAYVRKWCATRAENRETA